MTGEKRTFNGSYISEALEKVNIKQMVRDTGIGEATLYKLRKGRCDIGYMNILIQICEYLGLDPRDYFVKSNSTNKSESLVARSAMTIK